MSEKFSLANREQEDFNFDVKTQVAASVCCECGAMLDGVSGPCQPSPGDMTLCIYCGCLNVFDDDMLLRRPTDDEFLEAAASTFGPVTMTNLDMTDTWEEELCGSCRYIFNKYWVPLKAFAAANGVPVYTDDSE